MDYRKRSRVSRNGRAWKTKKMIDGQEELVGVCRNRLEGAGSPWTMVDFTNSCMSKIIRNVVQQEKLGSYPLHGTNVARHSKRA